MIHHPLFAELNWFVSLRWVAGLTVVVAGIADQWSVGFISQPHALIYTGVVIVSYNAVLWKIMHQMEHRRLRKTSLVVLAWAQILLDLACLSFLTAWTGGIYSPMLGLFVLHMVFASLLLRQRHAYVCVLVAFLLLMGGLRFAAGQKQLDHGQWAIVAGWAATMLLTVFLANHLTRSLRKQHTRLRRQNRRIRGMTRRLRQQQKAMIQHEKMAATGQMAAGLAHEIANPLASMDSLLQLMQRKPERVDADSFKKLRDQVDRLNSIVTQITDFAHPGKGPRQLVDINEAADKALEVVRFDRRIKNVCVDKQFADDAGMCMVQPQALQQVLVNLVLNAFDAMVKVDGPSLHIQTGRSDGYCDIAITDNGHGIEPEHMPHLFEPFFTTKPVGQGTGLGLAISYNLIKENGGEILVSSQPGRGTTFTIRLPLQ